MIFFPTQNVLSGESGDDQNLNNPKELKIDINDVLETLKNKNEKTTPKLTLLKEPRDIEDPFNKDLPMLIKYRGYTQMQNFTHLSL